MEEKTSLLTIESNSMKTLPLLFLFVLTFSCVHYSHIQAQVPEVDICLVTVDSASTHNIIVWEKPVTAEIDSFFVYRIFSDSMYYKVGAVHYDSLSTFHDLDPAADPNTDPHRYKLSTLDTSGNESVLSDFHQTMHLTVSTAGDMLWSWYKIENASNPVTTFNCYRDDDGTGNFQLINTLPGNDQDWVDSDITLHPNARYVIDVDWPISCSPTRENVETTRSNLDERVAPDTLAGVSEALAQQIEIYPNPGDGTINVKIPMVLEPTEIIIWSGLGAMAYKESIAGGNYRNPYPLNIPSVAPGIYLVEILTTSGSTTKKIVVR